MIHENERISRRQYLSICFLGLLSPIIRQLPRIAPRLAGNAAWLSGLASLPILLLYERIMVRLQKKRAEGEGMGEVFLRVYGKAAGSVLLVVYALWMLCYSGFAIAASADRLLTTAYPLGGKLMFLFIMGALGLLAVLSRLRTLARAANLLRPVMLIMLLAVLVSSLLDADLVTLLPITAADLVPVMELGAVVSNVLLLIVSFSFLENRVAVEGKRSRGWRVSRLFCVMALLVTLILAAVLANFGPEFAVRQAHPFFAMTRNIKIFGSFERVEPLIIVMWVLTDFVLVAALQQSALTILRLVLRKDSRVLLPVLCSAVAVGFALLMERDTFQISYLADKVFPLSGACISFGLFPLTLLVGLLRRKI